MYKIKSTPADFIVKEISNIDFKEEGKYLIYLLKKTNYTTIRALELLSKKLHIPLKNLSFAGTKDKNAVTEQYISIKGVLKERVDNLKLKDIELTFIGYLDAPISLGNLEGNEFIITVRELNQDQISNLENKANTKILMRNYFGEQRFSTNNKDIGKALLKKDYKEAINLVLATNSDYDEKIKEFLKNNSNNYIGALNIIPKKLLRLFAHSYQSFIWNKTLALYLKNNKENIEIPLLGFDTEFDNKEIETISTNIMQEEQITFRDFINKNFPEISAESSDRDAFIEIKDLNILEKTGNTIKINFKLQRGSYATEAIKFLFS